MSDYTRLQFIDPFPKQPTVQPRADLQASDQQHVENAPQWCIAATLRQWRAVRAHQVSCGDSAQAVLWGSVMLPHFISTFLLYLSSPKYCKPQELSTLIQNTSSFWRLIIYSLIFCAWHSLLCLFLSNIQCYLMKSNVDFTVTRGKKKQCVSRVWIMKWHNTQNTTHPLAEYIHWGVAAEVMPMKKETIAYVFRVHSALEVSMIIHMYEFLTSS